VSAIAAYADRLGLSATAVSTADARSLTFRVVGRDARVLLDGLGGVHRVQRVPKNDARGRKHTSTATVALLSDSVPATVTLRRADLRIDRMRGSGTGGQRRNKVETAVRVTHLTSGIVVTRLSGRSQAANIEDAKREVVARLQARAQAASVGAVVAARRAQIGGSGRAGKDFTHCWYRDEVVRHADGRRWTVRQWDQGRLD